MPWPWNGPVPLLAGRAPGMSSSSAPQEVLTPCRAYFLQGLLHEGYTPTSEAASAAAADAHLLPVLMYT